MAKESEYSTRTRLMRIFRAILEQPYRYTRQALATRYNKHPDTITGDIEAFRDAGFVVDQDGKYRYGFMPDRPLKQLKELLHFSEEDQELLHRAIDSLPTSTERQQALKSKLASLYDFKQLGHSYLRKPYLTKVDQLLAAMNDKKQVVLKGYRSSNSNFTSDRIVEPFHISPPDDTLQAFDVDKKILRHFRISRITRVSPLEKPWAHEGSHVIMRTDPFRIVDNNQVMVHLRLRTGAYNELVERYPMTKSWLLETEDPDTFDFQCMVNHRFLGLSNFILGFYHLDIQVLQPETLIRHLRDEVGRMHF